MGSQKLKNLARLKTNGYPKCGEPAQLTDPIRKWDKQRTKSLRHMGPVGKKAVRTEYY